METGEGPPAGCADLSFYTAELDYITVGGGPRQDIGPSKIRLELSIKPRLLSKYDIEKSYLWLHIFQRWTLNTFEENC